jgi:hypothetical protein
VLSEEDAVIGHAERWEAVVAVERKKSSLSRKVAAVIEGGEEEAVIEGGSHRRRPVGASLCTTLP